MLTLAQNPRRLLLATLVLFQSHWLDDVLINAANGEPDSAGIIVSAIGSATLVAVLLAPRLAIPRAVGALGLAFIAFISVADLAGLQPDGSRVPDLAAHWSAGLGWPLTAVVAATLVCAVGSLVLLRRRSGPSRSG